MAKKIKKKPDIEDVLGIVQSEKDQVKSSISTPTSKPSEYGKFIQWRFKEFSEWNHIDFIGYYLKKYLEFIKIEDSDFKSKKDDHYWAAGEISHFLKEVLDSDKNELKAYIDWIFPWWVSEESFPSGIPSFSSLFSIKKTMWYKFYLVSKVEKPKTKKILKTRRELDNHFASKSAWDEYYEGSD